MVFGCVVQPIGDRVLDVFFALAVQRIEKWYPDLRLCP